jgi:hypothetical protein
MTMPVRNKQAKNKDYANRYIIRNTCTSDNLEIAAHWRIKLYTSMAYCEEILNLGLVFQHGVNYITVRIAGKVALICIKTFFFMFCLLIYAEFCFNFK